MRRPRLRLPTRVELGDEDRALAILGAALIVLLVAAGVLVAVVTLLGGRK